jgi:hypothetical protein
LDRKPGRRLVTVLPPIMRPASGERAERVIGGLAALLLVQMDGDAAYEHGDQNLHGAPGPSLWVTTQGGGRVD